MFLSRLLINVGTNPDRPRPGRSWLRNRYHVHQRLCMAFPSKTQKEGDEHFLKPYDSDNFGKRFKLTDQSFDELLKEAVPPEVINQLKSIKDQEFEAESEFIKAVEDAIGEEATVRYKVRIRKHANCGQVHVERSADTGFLFHIDPLANNAAVNHRSGQHAQNEQAYPNGRAMILVQSSKKPDWDYAFHNADFFLAAPPEVKPFEMQFTKGQWLRFRLEANPTRRLCQHSKDAKVESYGKRVPVANHKLLDWLAGRGGSLGYAIDKKATIFQPGYVYVQKGTSFKLTEPSFEGLLQDSVPAEVVELLKSLKNQKFNIPTKFIQEVQDRIGEELTKRHKDTMLKHARKKCKGQRLRSVRFEGLLQVTDAQKFQQTLLRGIGSGKAFGFGMLLVAPTEPLSDEEAM